MRHNIVSLKLKYNHGTTEYRGIFSRYLPWIKISGTAQHYCLQCVDMLFVENIYVLMLHVVKIFMLDKALPRSLL